MLTDSILLCEMGAACLPCQGKNLGMYALHALPPHKFVSADRVLLFNASLASKASLCLQVLPLCESVGVELDFSSNALLSASLEAACAAAPPAVATLIKSLTTRAMSEAEYFCTGMCTAQCCA